LEEGRLDVSGREAGEAGVQAMHSRIEHGCLRGGRGNTFYDVDGAKIRCVG